MVSNEQVPQSFLDRPCQRCGGHSGRFDEERQRWLCLCFYEHQGEQVVIEPTVIRPDWDELRARAKSKRRVS